MQGLKFSFQQPNAPAEKGEKTLPHSSVKIHADSVNLSGGRSAHPSAVRKRCPECRYRTHNDLPQQRRHGPYCFWGDEDQRVMIGVRPVQRAEQGDDGGGQRQGGHAGIVRHGALVQRIRYVLKDAAHGDKVIRAGLSFGWAG